MYAWLKLIRLPNILTVPGDALAGFCIAAVSLNKIISFKQAYPIMLASIMFYCAGLIINDIIDINEDTNNQLKRPLVTQEINPFHAKIVAVFLLCVGIFLGLYTSKTTGIIAIILTLNILIYNMWAKKNNVLAGIFMGLCRGLSLFMGASILGWQSITHITVLIVAIGESLYIMSVTMIAYNERQDTKIGWLKFMPFGTLFITLSYILTIQNQPSIYFVILALISTATAFKCSYILSGTVKSNITIQIVGVLITNLIFFQTALIGLYNKLGLIFAGVALILFNTNKLLRKHFYTS